MPVLINKYRKKFALPFYVKVHYKSNQIFRFVIDNFICSIDFFQVLI